jgi:hypothetical protein
MLKADLLGHPSIQPQQVLPIVREGNTVALHLWYRDVAVEK